MTTDAGEIACPECGSYVEIVDWVDDRLAIGCTDCGWQSRWQRIVEPVESLEASTSQRDAVVVPSPEQSKDTDNALRRHLECVSHEIARLEQVVAALTLLIHDGSVDEDFANAFDYTVGWAMQQFDSELLIESLAEFFQPPQTPRVRPANQPSERQKTMFESDDTDEKPESPPSP